VAGRVWDLWRWWPSQACSLVTVGMKAMLRSRGSWLGRRRRRTMILVLMGRVGCRCRHPVRLWDQDRRGRYLGRFGSSCPSCIRYSWLVFWSSKVDVRLGGLGGTGKKSHMLWQ
jgi:hypothetical protein